MDSKYFLRMAVRELTNPDSERGLLGEAEVALMGSIGEVSSSKESFICNGLQWLENISDQADDAARKVTFDFGERDVAETNELIRIIRKLASEANKINRNEFERLLAEDWDDIHC